MFLTTYKCVWLFSSRFQTNNNHFASWTFFWPSSTDSVPLWSHCPRRRCVISASFNAIYSKFVHINPFLKQELCWASHGMCSTYEIWWIYLFSNWVDGWIWNYSLCPHLGLFNAIHSKFIRIHSNLKRELSLWNYAIHSGYPFHRFLAKFSS